MGGERYRRPWVRRDPRQANVKLTRPKPPAPVEDPLPAWTGYLQLFLDWFLVILLVLATVYILWR
jgi:hypothetical protein